MHSIYFFTYLCIEHLLVMDSIVKIVLAFNLKFLLILGSMGTSYFIEHSLKKQLDPVSAIEIIGQDSGLMGTGNIDARSLFRVADDNNGSRLGSSHPLPIQHVNYATDRPFGSQGLEINIEL